MKTLFSTTIAAALTLSAFAQKSDGTTKSLVNADKELTKAIANSGDKTAFVEYSSPTALVFRPNAVNVKTFYAEQTSSEKNLVRKPNLAKVARSGEWGFITGPYESGDAEKKYGQYLSIWKADNGKWKLALDLETSSNKPLNTSASQFVEPYAHFSPKFVNEKDIKANREIILTTEKTLNTLLKTHGIAAFSGFVTEDSRLLFPGHEAINGKNNILAFYNGVVDKINLKTTAADKSLGNDFAYTYGVATIDYKSDLRESFNYIFVWEKDMDHAWNLVVQSFVPAER